MVLPVVECFAMKWGWYVCGSWRVTLYVFFFSDFSCPAFPRCQGKTLEVIGLIVAHPHSPQPFPSVPPLFESGTDALSHMILKTPSGVLRTALERLARAPTRAACAFSAANAAASGAPAAAELNALRVAAAREACLPGLNDPSLPFNALVESRATLVVAPAGIIRQWAEELRRWCPRLAVVSYLESLSFGSQHAAGSSGAPARSIIPWYNPATQDWRPNELLSASAPMSTWQLRWLAALASADVVLAPFEALDQELRVFVPPPPPLAPGEERPVYKCPQCAQKLKTPNGFIRHAQSKHNLFLTMALISSYVVRRPVSGDAAAAAAAAAPPPPAPVPSSRGLLLSIFWHRVVLDEVQQLEVKSSDTTAAMAAAKGGGGDAETSVGSRLKNAVALQAAHRWAVSGTPLDSLFDVGATLRFLRHQPFGQPAWFNAVLRPAFNDSSRLAGVRAGARSLASVRASLKAAVAAFKAVFVTRNDLRPASLQLEEAALSAEACVEPFAPAATSRYISDLLAAARQAAATSVFARNFDFDRAPTVEQRKKLPSDRRCERYETQLLPLLESIDTARALKGEVARVFTRLLGALVLCGAANLGLYLQDILWFCRT